MRGKHDPERNVGPLGQQAVRDQQRQDHPHRLLGIVPAVSEAERGGRDQLATSEPPVELLHLSIAMEQPEDAGHEREREEDPDDRRQHDEHEDLLVLGGDQRSPTRGRDGGARQTADERVRGARREPQDPRHDVPEDRAHQRGEDPGVRERARVDDVRDRVRHLGSEDEERGEVEERRPRHGLPGRQHPRRNDRGDRIGGVVETVEEVEGQRDQDDQRDGDRHANLATTDSI